jgi:hypothetical protein
MVFYFWIGHKNDAEGRQLGGFFDSLLTGWSSPARADFANVTTTTKPPTNA